MPTRGFVIALCLVLLSPLAAVAEADPVDLLAAAIRAGAVRPVPESVIRADAARIAASLTPARRHELLAGTLLPGELVIPERRIRRQSSDLRSLSAAVLGDAKSELLFVPVAPCRVIDTRRSGGSLAAGTQRDFVVSGTDDFPAQGGAAGGCGIPTGALLPLASAVAINFIAVGPLAPGNLRAWEFGQPIPNASVVNYSNVAGLNIANGVIVPIAGVDWQPHDITVRADVGATHVVADVTGYFTRFPVERLKTTVAVGPNPGNLFLGDGACHQVSACTVIAPVAGRVVVSSYGQVSLSHAAGTEDLLSWRTEVDLGIPVSCGGGGTARIQIPSGLPAGDFDTPIARAENFAVSAGAVTTFRVGAMMSSGADPQDIITAASMNCLFVPN
jgi:hypothetical protein